MSKFWFPRSPGLEIRQESFRLTHLYTLQSRFDGKDWRIRPQGPRSPFTSRTFLLSIIRVLVLKHPNSDGLDACFWRLQHCVKPLTFAALRRVIPITALTHTTYHIRILAAIEALTLWVLKS